MIRLSQLTTRALRILGTLFVLSLLVVTAEASPDSVLVITAGQDEDRDILLANAHKALGDANVGIADSDVAHLNGFDPTATIVCLEQGEDCRDLVRQAPAKWLLLLRLKRESDDPDADHRVIASLFSADEGKLLQAKQAVCQSCSSRERMAKIITELVSELALAELATRAEETYITINASPAHAILKIDSRVVGPCGQAYQVSPGEHTIEISIEGYHGVKQSVLVKANENKSLSITLSSQSSDKPETTGAWKKPLGWGLVGGGLLTIAGGAYLYSQDGDPISASPGARSPTVKDRKASGGLVMAAGALGTLLGTGILLFLTDEDTSSNKTKITTQPSTNGFSLGLSGTF